MALPLRLFLGGDPSEAKRLRNDLRAWLLESGVNGTAGYDIVLAVNEAFINAVEHPVDRTSSTIEVTAEFAGREITVRIRDDGQWQEDLDPGRNHYGHNVMRTVMTDVTTRRTPTGTQVTLRKVL